MLSRSASHLKLPLPNHFVTASNHSRIAWQLLCSEGGLLLRPPYHDEEAVPLAEHEDVTVMNIGQEEEGEEEVVEA